MHSTVFKVTGMSCEHCVNAVTRELTQLQGVSGVGVDLVPDGISLLTITSTGPLADEKVRAALDEAGDYVVVPS